MLSHIFNKNIIFPLCGITALSYLYDEYKYNTQYKTFNFNNEFKLSNENEIKEENLNNFEIEINKIDKTAIPNIIKYILEKPTPKLNNNNRFELLHKTNYISPFNEFIMTPYLQYMNLYINNLHLIPKHISSNSTPSNYRSYLRLYDSNKCKFKEYLDLYNLNENNKEHYIYNMIYYNFCNKWEHLGTGYMHYYDGSYYINHIYYWDGSCALDYSYEYIMRDYCDNCLKRYNFQNDFYYNNYYDEINRNELNMKYYMAFQRGNMSKIYYKDFFEKCILDNNNDIDVSQQIYNKFYIHTNPYFDTDKIPYILKKIPFINYDSIIEKIYQSKNIFYEKYFDKFNYEPTNLHNDLNIIKEQENLYLVHHFNKYNLLCKKAYHYKFKKYECNRKRIPVEEFEKGFSNIYLKYWNTFYYNPWYKEYIYINYFFWYKYMECYKKYKDTNPEEYKHFIRGSLLNFGCIFNNTYQSILNDLINDFNDI